MANETERSQIIKRSIGVLVGAKGDENASWQETALAGTQDCSDSVRRNLGIDGLVSVSRRGTRFPVFAPWSPVAALILSAHRSQAKMNSTTTTSAGWLRFASTHLRNGSGIRRSWFVLSAKHAPPRSPGSFLHVDQMTAETVRSHQEQNSFVGTAFLGSGHKSRGVEAW